MSFLSISLWIHISWGGQLFWVEILFLFVINVFGQIDMLTGRIPIYFLLVGFVLGLILGFVTGEIKVYVIGGLSNLVISTLIYLTGQIYIKRTLKSDNPVTAFGMGDVYASGAVGFFLGFPLGSLAILLTLVLAVVGALIHSIFSGQEFLKRPVKLGVSYYLATILLAIVEAF